MKSSNNGSRPKRFVAGAVIGLLVVSVAVYFLDGIHSQWDSIAGSLILGTLCSGLMACDLGRKGVSSDGVCFALGTIGVIAAIVLALLATGGFSILSLIK